MGNSVWPGPGEKSVEPYGGLLLRPRGLVDLRGPGDVPALLSYPPGAVVVVSGLPGSGKSTLLRRWSEAASVVDPRTVHLACEAVMPARLPYAVYRPWARWKYFRWLRTAVRDGEALLVHDCGGRPWMRRWLARSAGRQGRELHLVLLDVGVAEALSGQQARGRLAPRRAFVRHRRGLDRLLGALSGLGAARLPAPRAAADEADDARSPHAVRLPKRSAPSAHPAADPVPEAKSVVLLDRGSRAQVAAVEFVPVPARPPRTEDGVRP
ncbi:AAA family ATPase [Streptomyces sp. DSM 41527]|uniref:AAA family ATPase n=1 Tax=Streptomyces mooreae TaxID=3075523 RepID=A0ABU2T5N8_9ACTN|nr:AAA family ATPase [Streptomyces sp. DSM 41527]MDT0456340.1 AAA family ATPase [Streptomyces sp. DSM 41527]